MRFDVEYKQYFQTNLFIVRVCTSNSIKQCTTPRKTLNLISCFNIVVSCQLMSRNYRIYHLSRVSFQISRGYLNLVSLKKWLFHSAVLLLLQVLLVVSTTVSADEKGLERIQYFDKDRNPISTDFQNYALLIGISDYTEGWQDLKNVQNELDQVEKTLKNKGYKIVRKKDLDSKKLKGAFEEFIKDYGYKKNNRLLFFYSGHGHSMEKDTKGYLVPADAPDPHKNPEEFKKKALNMTRLMSWAHEIEAIHALFLFDSCFSGMIFKQRSSLTPPPTQIDKFSGLPVRQFITAGSAGQSVPAQSTFTPAFIDAINGRADSNKDGYVIGTEIGLFLQDQFSENQTQTPQFGKINSYELSRGEFVFVVGKNVNITGKDVIVITGENENINLTIPKQKLEEIQNAEEHEETPLPIIVIKKEKQKSWFSNPWFWVGTLAVGALATSKLTSDEEKSGTGTIIFNMRVNH